MAFGGRVTLYHAKIYISDKLFIYYWALEPFDDLYNSNFDFKVLCSFSDEDKYIASIKGISGPREMTLEEGLEWLCQP